MSEQKKATFSPTKMLKRDNIHVVCDRESSVHFRNRGPGEWMCLSLWHGQVNVRLDMPPQTVAGLRDWLNSVVLDQAVPAPKKKAKKP